jgi:glycosyltransferase involved in cell wall biosynthesis
MTGEYFSWLSHDDLYEKNKIEDQINIVRSIGRNDVVVAANAKVLYANGIVREELIDKDLFGYFDIFLSISAEIGVNGCTLLIPRKALVENNGFDTNLPVTQDYDLWFRLNKSYEFVLLEKNLVISRRHDKQDSVVKQKKCFEDSDKLHYDFLNDIAYERFEAFFKSNHKNIKKAWDSYCLYKTNGYKKTASMILKNILKYHYNNNANKFLEVFESEIGIIIKSDLAGGEKNKKRVLFFSSVWHRGGIERVLSHIFNNLSEKYDLFLVVNDDKNQNNLGYSLPDDMSYIKINNQNQIAELINVLSLFDIDVFVGNPNFSNVFLDIYPLLEGTLIKSVAYNHGHYFLPYMCDGYLYPTALKIKEAYSKADYVVWLSQIACNVYNIDNNNGVYLPDPVNLVPDKKAKKVANKKILAVGRFDDEIKRIDNILLTFKELHKINHEYHLEVVGYCPISLELPWQDNVTLEEFIKNENIPVDNIKFWGIREDVSRFYDEASFLLMASRCEGFAMVLVEALSHGTPCACFEYIGIEEIIQSGQNGWVLPQGGYAGMAERIDSSINNKKAYREMSRRSLESVKKYGIDSFCDKWEELICQTINGCDNARGVFLPSNGLSDDDYRRIILEYEKLLNIAVKNFINNKNVGCTIQGNGNTIRIRLKDLLHRFKVSIKREGIFLTGEKIIRKVYKKVKCKISGV